MLYKFNKIHKKLIKGRKRSNAGRATNGRICVRFKGGCNKRKYREVDFTFKTIFPVSQILTVEYDPNRSGFISLIKNLITNKNSYILTPNNINKGHLIISFKQKGFEKANISNLQADSFILSKFARVLKLIYLLNIKNYVFIDKEFSDEKFNLLLYVFVKKRFTSEIPLLQNNGNVLPLYLINKGNPIFNIEARPNTKGIFARAAGVFATILFHTQKSTIVYLGAGEYKILNKNCFASIGRVSNVNKKQKKLRKASDSRWKNKLPHVRGVAMNPVDHPHGGGEGKTSGGRPSVTPWGIPTKGFKTSRKKKLFKSTLINIMNASSQGKHI